mmetsp:Transcript_4833/g.8418  ORF Transcript_4833/g.8418 Transcript_4833/m.8418 type:complete len:86 (+) Transcript_4833:2128-2385(+)
MPCPAPQSRGVHTEGKTGSSLVVSGIGGEHLHSCFIPCPFFFHGAPHHPGQLLCFQIYAPGFFDGTLWSASFGTLQPSWRLSKLS